MSPSPEYILLVKLARFGDPEALRHLRAVIGPSRSDETANEALGYARQLPGMLANCTTGSLVDLIGQLANNGPGGSDFAATWVRLVHLATNDPGALEQLERVAAKPDNAATLAAARAYPKRGQEAEDEPAPKLPPLLRDYARDVGAVALGRFFLDLFAARGPQPAEVSPEALASCKARLNKIRGDLIKTAKETEQHRPDRTRRPIGFDSGAPVAPGAVATITSRSMLPLVLDELWIPPGVAGRFLVEKFEAMDLDAMHGSPAPGAVFSADNTPDGPPRLSVRVDPAFDVSIQVRNTSDAPARFTAAAFGRHPDAGDAGDAPAVQLRKRLIGLDSKGLIRPGETARVAASMQRVGFLSELVITEGADAFSIDAILVGNNHQSASNNPIPGALFDHQAERRPRLRTDTATPATDVGLFVTNTSQEARHFAGSFVALCLPGNGPPAPSSTPAAPSSSEAPPPPPPAAPPAPIS